MAGLGRFPCSSATVRALTPTSLLAMPADTFRGIVEQSLSTTTDFRVTSAYGEDSLDQTAGTNATITTLRPLSARAELSQKIGRRLTANLGLDVVYEPYDLNLQLPPMVQPGIPSGGDRHLRFR